MPLPLCRLLLVGVMSAALAACATPRASDSPLRTPSPAPSVTAAPTLEPSSDDRAPSPSRTAGEIAAEPPPLALEAVASGLEAPINITAAPSGWLLINERRGRVVAVDPTNGETAVAVDLTDRVRGEGERGLLGLALHPGWPDVARVFIHYSDLNGDTVLSELGADADSDPPIIDPGSERILLQVRQPFANHNGGQLAFGPDGFLYLGLGDGGSGGDPEGNGQNPQTVLGTILRLDVSEPGTYSIPAGNPFAGGDAGAAEVYLYGLRNPWRFSFDRGTGLLWIADVGQNAYEEVNRVDPQTDAGANLGWAVMEASHCFADPACSSDGMLMPVAEYGRDLGCSITGGHVYRGEALPDLRGWYLAGDYCTGIVFGVRSDTEGDVVVPRVLLDSDAAISSFGEGPDGELYVADLTSGTIYRIVPAG